MLKKILKFFHGPTPEELYDRGRKYAKDYLADGGSVEYLEACIDSARIICDWTQFDSGIRDHLLEIGNGCSEL